MDKVEAGADEDQVYRKTGNFKKQIKAIVRISVKNRYFLKNLQYSNDLMDSFSFRAILIIRHHNWS